MDQNGDYFVFAPWFEILDFFMAPTMTGSIPEEFLFNIKGLIFKGRTSRLSPYTVKIIGRVHDNAKV